MGIIDIIIVICFLPCIYFGLKNGLVKQIVSICVIYFGITLSLKYSSTVCNWICAQGWNLSEFVIKIISFILIFAIIAIIFSLLGHIIEKIIQISLLKWLNSLLGIVLSFFEFLLVISLVVYFINSVNDLLNFIPEGKIAESRFFHLLVDFANNVFPKIKELF